MKSIHVLRKPCSESTVAANMLKHGAGGLNIDECRVGTSKNVPASMKTTISRHTVTLPGNTGTSGWDPNVGRWPANLVLQHLDGCVQDGVKKMPGHKGYPNGPGGSSMHYASSRRSSEVRPSAWKGHADPDGTETVAAWACVEGCPVAALDAQSGVLKSGALPGNQYTTGGRDNSSIFAGGGVFRHKGYGADTGGASRFFKQVKP